MFKKFNTLPVWVELPIDHITKTLFITENYPGDPEDIINKNTYFYRTLNPSLSKVKGANNLLNNLCKTLNIESDKEEFRLKDFIHKFNYFLIDSFPSGKPMSKHLINETKFNEPWLDKIIEDIEIINPENIIFTCVGSNGILLPILINRAITTGKVDVFKNILLTPDNKVFKSPSNRWFHDQKINGITHKGFHSQIKSLI